LFHRLLKSVVETKGYEDFYIVNEVLFKDPNKELLVVPSLMETEIIKQGHFSSKKTQDLIEKSYYIPKLKEKLARVVDSCVECILVNAKAGRQEGFLTPINKGDKPLVTYHVDHVGPMELTKRGYNHIIVIVDAFFKYVWLHPTRSTGVEEVVTCLERQAVCFGNPYRIVSDHGAAFTSHLFKEYCDTEKIQHLLIATGVPRKKGQVERMHKIVVPMLSKLSLESPGCCYKHVGKVQQIINNTEPRSTKVSPFKLLTGLDMRISGDVQLKSLKQDCFISELDGERHKLRQEARENIQSGKRESFLCKKKGRKEVPVKRFGSY